MAPAGAIFVLTVLSKSNRQWSNYAIYKKAPGLKAGAKTYLPVFRYLDNEFSAP
ncbi:MAG: hypothetical protein JNM63_08785 [Spirochaetia bacterium]|nr:hypothetical protein [Spirochaetia bacterium]